MSFDAETFYNLLPAFYRVKDAEQGEPLRELLDVIAGQIAVVEENLEQLYDDQFIETCAEWVVPYLGDLIGARGLYSLPTGAFSARAQVADTLAYRRRKGTAAVIEQLARDVTNWEARVVEFFQLLETCQQLNHLGELPATLNLRQGAQLEYVNTAFEQAAHSVDVRSIARLHKRYNIPNVGIFLWRLAAYPLTHATPFGLADGFRFLFNPLGANLPLFNAPQTEEQITHLAEPINVPMPITRRAMYENLSRYYGTGKSVWITLDHGGTQGLEDVPAGEVIVCNLSDRPDGSWGARPATKYAIDPELGRLMLPANLGAFEGVRVSFQYGFSAELGGGEYNRAPTLGACEVPGIPPPPLTGLDRNSGNMQAALDAVQAGGVVEIADSATYHGGLVLNVNSGACVELRAADGARPLLVLAGEGGGPNELTISGGEGAEVTLNGLVLSAGALRVPAGGGNALRRLTLRHCTLVPGLGLQISGSPQAPGAAALIAELPKLEIEIENCILGGLRVVDGAQASLVNSIVDANSPDGVAYAGLDGLSAGGNLSLESCTVIGKVHASWIDEASNSIFFANPAQAESWPAKAPVAVKRLQQGCVRYSFVPPGSQVPRRYACQPAAGEEVRIRPVFTSIAYGDPGYLQLDLNCATEIRSGAEDGAEMGVFNLLKQPQREANLRIRLKEYLPFRLEAGIFYVS
jgi:hypothetical protein